MDIWSILQIDLMVTWYVNGQPQISKSVNHHSCFIVEQIPKNHLAIERTWTKHERCFMFSISVLSIASVGPYTVFSPQQPKLMGSSAQIGRVPQGSGVCWCRFQEGGSGGRLWRFSEGAGGFRRRFWRVLLAYEWKWESQCTWRCYVCAPAVGDTTEAYLL